MFKGAIHSREFSHRRLARRNPLGHHPAQNFMIINLAAYVAHSAASGASASNATVTVSPAAGVIGSFAVSDQSLKRPKMVVSGAAAIGI